jgi:photosystem II stability/assembly factor-like uncharacterized protein
MFLRRSSRYALLSAALCALIVTARVRAEPPSPEMVADAELTDVTFIDPDRGFAVGDRGAIWRTEDGGRHWRLTASPVACRWESVTFIDELNGWIVGGSVQQLTHQSTGAVLRTSDGGRTWTQVPKLIIPGLAQARFFDNKRGIAIGHATEFSPAGIFRTSNGGQTWAPLASAAPIGWHSAAFHDAQRGVTVGDNGTVMVLGAEKLTPARLPNLAGRPVRRVAFSDPRSGWLVGDGGLVLTTDDGGIQWKMPPGPLPSVVLEQMDFRALAVRDNQCWMAGAPGSVILHSADGGASWELLRTEQATPIRALYFIDDQRGWAVGALGTILATRDGGKTWAAQHRGGIRAPLLTLVSQPDRVPLEVITRLGGNDGYFSAVEILNASDSPPRYGHVPRDERTSAAVSALGGSAADSSWRFPVRDERLFLSAEAIIKAWNPTAGGDGVGQLESHVVRRIRQWRPDVIITERASARGDEPLAHVTNQIVLAAVAKAGDPAAFPEQIRELGLAVWKTKKVFSLQPPEAPGMLNLSTAQLAPRLGGSLADVTTASRCLINDDYQPAAQQLGFQLVLSTLSRDVAVRDFFSGISLSTKDEARRNLAETSPTTLDTLRRQAQRARNVQQLMARSAADQASGGSWLGQVDDLTQGLSRASAAQTLYELAWRYHHSGQWHSAADAFGLVVDRYRDHELADPAAMWLVQYYASSEAAVRMRGGTRVMSGDSGFAERPASLVTGGSDNLARPIPTTEQPSLNVRAHLATGSVGLDATQRMHRAIELAKILQQDRPRLHARPEIRFPLSAANRRVGLAREADALIGGFVQTGLRDHWWSCAAAEGWMLRPTPQGPKPMATCQRAAEKPKLDGMLDEAFWKSAKPLLLSPDDPRLPPTTCLLAQDGEFLYVAATCVKIPAFDYSLTGEERTHDADLSLHDRIELCLDTDRDYCTFHRLTFDYRGFTQDACLDDATWNPTWFVASAQDKQAWTIEAAIPLHELHLQPPQARESWAIGLSRIMPGEGISGWNRPALVKTRGESFGLLVFE